jgi:hypothetical protein
VSTFLQRLHRVIADRQPYPWAASVGWNKGNTARVMQGHVPGPELLVPVSWVENVRLDWLLTGRGAPFFANSFPDDATAALAIGYHFEDSDDWHVHVLPGPVGGFAVCLTMPAEVDVKGTPVPFTALEVFVGPLGNEVRDVIARAHEAGRAVTFTQLDDDEQWTKLQLGELGSYQLLYSDAAILKTGEALEAGEGEPDASQLLRVAESPPPAYGPTAISPQHRALVRQIEHLAPPDRAVIEQLLDRLSAKPV